jgi:hypothetical protein
MTESTHATGTGEMSDEYEWFSFNYTSARKAADKPMSRFIGIALVISKRKQDSERVGEELRVINHYLCDN